MSKQYAKVSLDESDELPHAPPSAVSSLGAPGGLTVDGRILDSPSSSTEMTSMPRLNLNSLKQHDAHATASSSSLPMAPDSTHSSVAGDTESTALMSSSDSLHRSDEQVDPAEAAATAGLVILDAQPPQPGEITVTLMRLGGSGIGNVRLNVQLDMSVGAVASRVYAFDISEGMRVRLIYMGRMLQDNETIRSIGVTHGQLIHALVKKADASLPGNLPVAQPVGEQLIGGEAEGVMMSVDGYPGNLQHFSPAELQQMRVAQEQHDNRFVVREGTSVDFLVGFLIGFLLGIISLICLVNSTYSRRQRLGIIVGVALNFGFGLRNASERAKDEVEPAPALTDSTGQAGYNR
jgi:hypothetical protein